MPGAVTTGSMATGSVTTVRVTTSRRPSSGCWLRERVFVRLLCSRCDDEREQSGDDPPVGGR